MSGGARHDGAYLVYGGSFVKTAIFGFSNLWARVSNLVTSRHQYPVGSRWTQPHLLGQGYTQPDLRTDKP